MISSSHWEPLRVCECECECECASVFDCLIMYLYLYLYYCICICIVQMEEAQNVKVNARMRTEEEKDVRELSQMSECNMQRIQHMLIRSIRVRAHKGASCVLTRSIQSDVAQLHHPIPESSFALHVSRSQIPNQKRIDSVALRPCTSHLDSYFTLNCPIKLAPPNCPL